MGPHEFYIRGLPGFYLYFQPYGDVWVWNSDFRHASRFENEEDARLALEDCMPAIRDAATEIQEWTHGKGNLVGRIPVRKL